MSKVKSRNIVKNLHYGDWVQRRAEQLAMRHQPELFSELFAKRCLAMGFDNYDEAISDFDRFLEGYKIEAYRAAKAEGICAHHLQIQNELKNMVKPTTPYAGEGTIELDEDQDENDECETCGAVIGKGDELCDDCEAEEN